MDQCCSDHHHALAVPQKAAPKKEEGCCGSCPDANCANCKCSKPENVSGCCMGGGCAGQ